MVKLLTLAFAQLTVRAASITELVLERLGPVIFNTVLVESIAFRVIPVTCPARGENRELLEMATVNSQKLLPGNGSWIRKKIGADSKPPILPQIDLCFVRESPTIKGRKKQETKLFVAENGPFGTLF